MECVQQTIASAELNGIIELPLALRNRKVQVIVLPAEDTETEQLRPQKRQLGFLKDKVPPLPDSFFDPLPEEDCDRVRTEFKVLNCDRAVTI